MGHRRLCLLIRPMHKKQTFMHENRTEKIVFFPEDLLLFAIRFFLLFTCLILLPVPCVLIQISLIILLILLQCVSFPVKSLLKLCLQSVKNVLKGNVEELEIPKILQEQLKKRRRVDFVDFVNRSRR